MRFKFSLLLMPEVGGDVIPIGYQYCLASQFHALLTEDGKAYHNWLAQNGLDTPELQMNLFSISNFYIPKIIVNDDRLQICVPRIQFWASFLPEVNTLEFLNQRFLNRKLSIGDSVTSVCFTIVGIDEISPVLFSESMEYQTLSPVVVKALRPNKTLEYLTPTNNYFAQFIVDELIQRWEMLNRRPYMGSRMFRFRLLSPERRKSVKVVDSTNIEYKVVGYMMKFRIDMAPELQEIAYITGIGDDVDLGFGYIELIKKRR